MSEGRRARTGMARWWPWIQVVIGLSVVAILATQLGARPFVAAFRGIDLWTISGAVVLMAFSTVCAAYRWQVVTHALEVPIGLASAVRAYYSSQLLNATLPGGVLGDVHRGLRHGQRGYSAVRCLRAVMWERACGQFTLAALAALGATVLPSAIQLPPPVDIAVVSALAACVVAGVVWTRRAARSRGAHPAVPRPSVTDRLRSGTAVPQRLMRFLRRAGRAFATDWRSIGAEPHGPIKVTIASVGAFGGHVAMFALAAHSVGAAISLSDLIPLAMVVLMVGAIPLNVAGWGPREGASATVFAVAGLGAAAGLSVSIAYGILALIGVLPGIATLLWWRRGPRGGATAGSEDRLVPAPAAAGRS